MHNQRAVAGAKQQILGATFERIDLAAGHKLREVARDWLTHRPISHDDGSDDLPGYMRRETTSRGFDFRQFRHYCLAGSAAGGGGGAGSAAGGENRRLAASALNWYSNGWSLRATTHCGSRCNTFTAI